MRLKRLITGCLVVVVAGSTVAFAQNDAPKAGARKAKANKARVQQNGDKKVETQWWGRKPEQARTNAAGKVASVGNGQIVITDKKKANHTFTVNDQTRIRVQGQKATLNDIKVGNAVVVRFDAGQTVAKGITVPKPFVNGTVASVNGSAITVTGKDSTTYTVNVTDATKIGTRVKYQGTIADLKPGYQVEAFGDLTGTTLAAKVVAFQPTVLRGSVTAKEGENITIKTVDQKTITGTTSAKTMVLIRPRTGDNKPGKLDDVAVGSAVNIGGHLNDTNMSVLFAEVFVGQ